MISDATLFDRLREELQLEREAVADLSLFVRLFEELDVAVAIWNLPEDSDHCDLIASNSAADPLLSLAGDEPPSTFVGAGLRSRLEVLLDATAPTALGEFQSPDGKRTHSLRGCSLGRRAVGVGFFDLTARKKFEAEQRATAERMQHAQKLESLGILAGGIAHDFNNLLAGILGNASLALLELPESSPVRPLLDRVEATARVASDLTRQMLAYSGRGRFVIEGVDVSTLVEEMVRLLNVTLSDRAVVRYDFAQGLPLIEADASQVRQVVMNLVTNASDALEGTSGSICVRTSLQRVDRSYASAYWLDDELEPGDYVVIEVSDTGSGMSEATKARLFDPFFTSKAMGRGLGMAAVLGIVRGHKGAIKVYSEEGKGTTIKALFPVAPSAEPSGSYAPIESARPMDGSLVLVVDDEETVRTIACKVLEREGCRTLAAEDGLEGLRVFEAHAAEIDLVLLDLTMPHLDGEEVFRVIRGLRPELPVILTSGYNEQDTLARFAGKGLAGFLQKPWTARELIAIASNTLAGDGA